MRATNSRGHSPAWNSPNSRIWHTNRLGGWTLRQINQAVESCSNIKQRQSSITCKDSILSCKRRGFSSKTGSVGMDCKERRRITSVPANNSPSQGNSTSTIPPFMYPNPVSMLFDVDVAKVHSATLVRRGFLGQTHFFEVHSFFWDTFAMYLWHMVDWMTGFRMSLAKRGPAWSCFAKTC